MRGWRWIPIHVPFSPSSLFFIILQTFYLSRAFTICVSVSYHPLLTITFSIRYNVRYISIRINYTIGFGYFHTFTTYYEVLNQSYIILCKCQYLEMLHSIAMVAWYSTDNAYKKMKKFETL